MKWCASILGMLIVTIALIGGHANAETQTDGIKLNGVDEYFRAIKQSQYDVTSQYSLQVLFKPNDLNQSAIVSKTENGGFSLYIEADKRVHAYLWVNGAYVHPNFDANLLKLHEWQYLTVTYDSKSMRLYLDGKLMDEKPATGKIKGSDVDLVIGGEPSIQGYVEHYFNGTVKKVQIWNRVLNSSEIGQPSPGESGLVGKWEFDPSTTKLSYDKSTYKNDARATGYSPSVALSADTSDIGLDVNWNTVPGVKYKLYRDGKEVYEGDKGSYSDKPLISDTSYQYSIQSTSINGEGLPAKDKYKTLVGSLQLVSVPAASNFNPITLNGTQQAVAGDLVNSLIIKDTRKNRDGWQLQVSGSSLEDEYDHRLPQGTLKVTAPTKVIQQEGPSNYLPSIIKGNWSIDDGSAHMLLKQSNSKGFGIYKIVFPNNSLKVSLDPGATFVNPSMELSNYQSNLNWTLVSGP